MTSQDQQAAENPTPATIKNKVIPFHARIQVFSSIAQKGQAQEATIQLGEKTVALPLVGHAQQQIKDIEPDKPYLLQLWFRTQSALVDKLQIASILPIKGGKEQRSLLFSIGGRISKVNKGEGIVVLSIEPNGQGLLQKAFEVGVWATLEQLEDKRIRPGRTLIMQGQYRPGSGRLVIQKIQHQRVGPKPEPSKQSGYQRPTHDPESRNWQVIEDIDGESQVIASDLTREMALLEANQRNSLVRSNDDSELAPRYYVDFELPKVTQPSTSPDDIAELPF